MERASPPQRTLQTLPSSLMNSNQHHQLVKQSKSVSFGDVTEAEPTISTTVTDSHDTLTLAEEEAVRNGDEDCSSRTADSTLFSSERLDLDAVLPSFDASDVSSSSSDDGYDEEEGDWGGGHVVNPRSGLSPFTSVLIVINYIGVGFTLLPGGFARGGPLLSVIILVFVSIQTYLTAHFLLEACARAEALEWLKNVELKQKEYVKKREQQRQEPQQQLTQQGRHSFAERSSQDVEPWPPLIANADDAAATTSTLAAIKDEINDTVRRPTLPRSYSIEIRSRKFEISVLNKMFLGASWSMFFSITTAMDLYGITWTFCSIFASSLADQAPVAAIQNDYQFYVGIFLIVALPLSCTSILDQLYIQMTFLSARILMFLLMVSTLVQAYYYSDRSFFGDQVGPQKDLPLCDWHGIVQAIQTAIFSTAFQFSVPSVGNISQKKTILQSIFRYATSIMFSLNLMLSLMVSLYFGRQTSMSNNLNWLNYHGGSAEGTWWSKAISGYIVVFAAVDGVAVYPLIALALGDIIMGAVYGEKVHQAEQNWKVRCGFRLAASVPQGLCAMFVRDLGNIAMYAGIFTVLSYTVCPSLLCIKSQERMRKEGHTASTYYSSNFLSSITWAYCLIAISILTIVGVIFDGTFIQRL